jgi:hypothetical protein
MSVTLVKSAGQVPVREVRFDLGGSGVLVHTRVIEYGDGAVQVVSRRRPGYADVVTGSVRVVVDDWASTFDQVVAMHREHETGHGFVTGEVSAHRPLDHKVVPLWRR